MKSLFDNSSKHLVSQLQNATLDHEAFQSPMALCELSSCKATCCHDGVQLSAEDAKLITDLVQKNQSWFEKQGIDTTGDFIQQKANSSGWKTKSISAKFGETADNFPSHFPKTRCVFLDDQHRCNLQKFSMKQNQHPWFHKPLTCWIHPILVKKESNHYTITLANKGNDPQKTDSYPGFCSYTPCGRIEPKQGKPAYEVLKNELLALGSLANRNFYEQLATPAVDWVIED